MHANIRPGRDASANRHGGFDGLGLQPEMTRELGDQLVFDLGQTRGATQIDDLGYLQALIARRDWLMRRESVPDPCSH